MAAHSEAERVYALAALLEAMTLVERVATTGLIEVGQLKTLVGGLFITNPEETMMVYGPPLQLQLGYRTLVNQLGDTTKKSLSLTRYTLQLLQLERKLARQPAHLTTISSELAKVARQVDHFSLTHTAVLARLDEIYRQTLSTMRPRIMVQGRNDYLKREENVTRVRALLLAAIRAAVLWRQCGGSRWHLLLRRQKIVDEAEKAIKNFTASL
ncbi:MAG: high frequency lysogenization protein HflD [Gammaproteobacteria bacterium]|nr:high frequency lysogenization protein HflD [Gammaproteobacteria bacterium]